MHKLLSMHASRIAQFKSVWHTLAPHTIYEDNLLLSTVGMYEETRKNDIPTL